MRGVVVSQLMQHEAWGQLFALESNILPCSICKRDKWTSSVEVLAGYKWVENLQIRGHNGASRVFTTLVLPEFPWI